MICMMNVPYVVLKYATLLLSFPVNNVVEVVLTTLTAVLKSTNKSSFLFSSFFTRNKTNTKNENSFYKYTKTPKQQQYIVTLDYFLYLLFFGCNTNVDNGNI